MVVQEEEKKKNKKRTTIITIEEEIIGPYSVNYVKRSEKHNNNNNKPKEDPRTKEEEKEKELVDAKALESIRRKAIKEILSEETTAKQKIDAGWRLLYSYGFEGNELQKSWKWFKRH